MAQMSSLIRFWNSKSEEAERKDAENPEKNRIRKWQCTADNQYRKLPVNKVENMVQGQETADCVNKYIKTRDKIVGDLDTQRKEKVIQNNGNAGLRPSPSTPSAPSSSTQPKSSPTAPPRPARNKPVSPFVKFKQLESHNITNNRLSSSRPTPSMMTSLSRNSSLPPSPRPTITNTQMVSGTTAVRAGSGAKEIILGWVQQTIKDYPIQKYSTT